MFAVDEREYTIDEIIQIGLSLKPAEVARRGIVDYERLCTTPVFTRIKGYSDLSLLGATYHGIYGRVSTAGQNTLTDEERQSRRNSKRNRHAEKDGWSMLDQLSRNIRYAVQRGHAFRIFSDAEIHGDYPPDDPAMIRQMCEARASNYQEAMEHVFLSPYVVQYTEEQQESIRSYIRGRVREILVGAAVDGEPPAEWESAFGVVAKRAKGKARMEPNFRPGLTILMHSLPDVHTVSANELNRLSRSASLTSVIAQRLRLHKVDYVGMVERDSYFAKQGRESKLVTSLMAELAESKLYEVMLGSIRGIVTMLEAGKPHATLPLWLRRNPDTDDVEIDPEGAEAVRLIIDLYLLDVEPNQQLGVKKIATELRRRGIKTKRGLDVWCDQSIFQVLRNKALMGVHTVFGLEYNIFPPLISSERYNAIQRRLEARSSINGSKYAGRPAEEDHLLSGLLWCRCGKRAHHRRSGSKRSKNEAVTTNTHNYSCPELHTTLKTRNGVAGDHLRLRQAEVDVFFNRLMSEFPNLLTSVMRSRMDDQNILGQIESLQAQARELRSARGEREETARHEAEETLATDGITPDDPDYRLELSSVIRRKLRVIDRQLDDIARKIDTLTVRLDTQSQKEVAALEERLAAWASMTISERNDALRRLFARIEHAPLRRPGKRVGEALVPVLRTFEDAELMPIYIEVKRSARGIERTMASVEEWIASWEAGRETEEELPGMTM